MRGWVAVLYLWFCTWFPTAPLPLDLRSLGGARQDDLPHEVFEQRLAEVFVRPRPRELHLAAALLREYVCVCVCVRVRACVCVSHRSATPNHPTQTPKCSMLLAPGDETAQRPCQVGARPFRHAARPPATGSTSPTRCRHQQWRLGRGHAHSRHPPGCVLCGVSRPCRFEWLPVRMAVTRVVV